MPGQRSYHNAFCMRFPNDRNIQATFQRRLTDSVSDFLLFFLPVFTQENDIRWEFLVAVRALVRITPTRYLKGNNY